MASDLDIQAAVVVNSEQAESAFNRVGDKAQQMANEVATSAGKAGQAVDKIGDGAGASAEKFTRAESRISAAIKRATNDLELLGKTASQRLEFNISDKGLDPKKFEPMLQRLRDVEAQAMAAQRAATGSLDKMGISAAQTAAALRGVPAQFTDIVTSLQGGQAPLTVFLQQGGQLKDMFGGAGAAARALGGYVVGLINPFTVAAAAGVALALAYKQGSAEADAYNKALITTGNAAGTNASQLKAYALEISGIVGTQGKAAESLAALAATGKVGAESLRDAAKAAVEYERATGQAVGKTAEQFASLRNEPLAAVLKLNDGMNFLTVSTYKQIKSLEEQGKTAEAANAAQRAFADTLSTRAGEMERNLGSVERGWIKVKDAAKGAWDAILNVGRASTSVDQLAEVRKQIAQRENQIANAGFASNDGGAAFGRPSLANTERLRAELSGLQAQAAALEGVAFATRTAAEEEGKRVELSKALIQFEKEGDQFKQKSAKRAEEVAKAENEGRKLILAGLLTEKELRERIADINKKYEDKGSVAAIAKEQSAYASLLATINEKIKANELDAQTSARITEADKLRIKLTEELATGTKKLSAAPQAVLIARLAVFDAQEREKDAIKRNVAAYKEEAEAAEETARAYVEQSKAREAGRAAVNGYAKGIDESSKALQYELSLMGLGEQARNVALEQYRIELDLKKQIEAIDANTGFNETQREEERAKARAAAAIATANASSRAFLDEWKQSVSTYEDVFRRGFADMLNNGKNGWKSFTRSLVTTFKTSVADQIYKMFAQPFVVNIVGNLLGLTGSICASAVSGGASALGMAGNAASLYGMGSRAMGFLGFGASAATTTGIGVGTSLANPGMAAMINPVAGTGAATGGFGSMLASIPGWGLALAGIAALGMLFSKKSTPHSGAGAIYSDAMGLQTGADIYNKPTFGMGIADEYNAETSKAVGGIAKGLAEALDGVAKTFGKTAGFEIATAFADDSSKDGAWGQLRISQGGKDLLNWAANPKRDGIPKEFADGQAGYAEYLAAIAQDTRQVLLDMDLPSWADTMLNAIGELSNMDQLSAVVQQIAEVQTMFVHLGDTLVGFAGMTDKAFEALLKASGGAQALAANADAFYQGFYSDSERKDIAKRQLSEKLKGLGVDISLDDPEANAKYRKLVEEQLAKANGEEAARSALKGSIAGALTGGGIDSLRGMDVGYIVRGVLGDAKDLTQADIDKLTSGIASLDTAGMSLNGLKDSVGKLLEPIVGTGKGAAETAAALLGLSGEFAGLTASADDLAEAEKKRAQEQIDARDKALRGLERSIAKEKEALQSRIDVAQEIASTMGGLFDLLHQNVRDLYSEVDSTRSMLAAQGNDFINQALQAARTTGYLPDQSQLADAISAARSGIDPGAYTSQFAADRDRLVLAGKLSELEGLTGKQLSSAERTVKELQSQSEQLDKTLDYWKEQIDIANGTYEATLSVADAIKNLTALTFPEKTPQQPGQPGSGGGPVEVVGGSEPGAGSTPSHPGQRTKDGGYYREVYLGDHSSYRATNADETARLNALADETKKWVGTGDVRGLLLDAKDSGYSLSDLATVYGWSYKDLLERSIAEGVPRFAVGTNYVPRDMLAQIHEGEAIVPKAYNPAANPGLAGDRSQRLEQLVERLTAEVEELRAAASATARNTAGLPQMVDQFDSVSNNGSALRNRPVTA